MTPTIRPATPDDIAAIHAIYAHHVQYGTGTFEIEAPTVEAMRSRFKQTAGRDYPFYVAVSDDEVIGYGYVGPFRERAAYQFTVEDSIYLHPEKRGQGIGRLLLNQLITASTERGFKQMIALIGDSDNRASIRLHATAGFRSTGTLQAVGRKFDRWLDVVIMQRPLGEE
ncbi:GNAT family N-acetyltransferase [Synoicihabitans lomoniglobus]|uniref:GNAT family N-acetyltransferase n=1 Tax=Synoicihabitans lomoniglobus TaxID=2909285 RepID=A0AAF0CHC5_9BACT|nr:N-acetyltransferase family protein [Opitutaceae bacterium LMO-M01]WED64142.1 GNAT family N-acetyltransferase [Opitutaceae bacterium LMO-M01]